MAEQNRAFTSWTAVVMAVHNRCPTTLQCLRTLQAHGVLAWARVYLVDDGSSDGTAEAVAAEFSDVRVVRGDGTLWWTGATVRGMVAALNDGAEAVLWLNDDTVPQRGACERLRDNCIQSGVVVVGTCVLPGTRHVVYGGMKRSGRDFELVTELNIGTVLVDAGSGNFVCIPRTIIDRVGLPDAARFPQAFGDLDYLIRVRQAGFRVLLDTDALADATPNSPGNEDSWLFGDVPLSAIWTGLWRKQSYSYAPAHLAFLCRHHGMAGLLIWTWLIIKRIAITLLRLALPRAWLRRAWSHRSRVWREQQTREALKKPASGGRRESETPSR